MLLDILFQSIVPHQHVIQWLIYHLSFVLCWERTVARSWLVMSSSHSSFHTSPLWPRPGTRAAMDRVSHHHQILKPREKLNIFEKNLFDICGGIEALKCDELLNLNC